MELRDVRKEDRELLWNINQKYLSEMTNYYDDPMDERGNLGYGYFEAYFSDPRRRAMLILDGGALVGFAMMHPYSNVGETPDFVLAEFSIFPMYRRRHLATEAVGMLFERFCGRWEIKYHEKNAAAKALWNKLTERFSPRRISLGETETVLAFVVGERGGA